MTQGNITKAVFNIDGANPLVRLTIDGKSYTTFASHPSQEAFDLLCEHNDPLRNPLVGSVIDFEHVEKPNRSGGEPWLNITSINDLQIASEVEEGAKLDAVLAKIETGLDDNAPKPPNPYEYHDSMERPPVYLNADRYIGANIAYDQWHIDQRHAMEKAIEIGGPDIFDVFYRILSAYRGKDPRADGQTIAIVHYKDHYSDLKTIGTEEAKDEKTTEG
jgi:hypothetical protein